MIVNTMEVSMRVATRVSRREKIPPSVPSFTHANICFRGAIYRGGTSGRVYGGAAPPNDQTTGFYQTIFLAPRILVGQSLKVSFK